MKKYKLVLCDVGNVLLDIDEGYWPFHFTEDNELNEKILKLHKKFAKGKLAKNIYYAKLKGLGIPKNQINEYLTTTFEEQTTVRQERIDFLVELKKDYPLYCLSNTNPVHEEYIRKLGIYDIFDEVFLSNHIGFLKPNKKTYDIVYEFVRKKLPNLNIEKDEIIFFDDLADNVEYANEFGFKAFKIDSDTSLDTLI